jgi:hypothetical protein
MFTVINGVLLKPLHYPEPDRLVTLNEQTKGITDYRWGDLWAYSYPNYLDCKRQSSSLDMAAWRYSGGTVSAPGEAEHVDGVEISSELFPVLGVTLSRGRAFLPEDDRPGAAPVAIISYGLWQRHFGGSPAAIGRPLVFEGKSYTIVGIAPAGFRLSWEPDVFTPIGQNTQTYTDPYEVVGVVGHVRYWGLAGDDQAQVRDQFYYPFAQVPGPLLPYWSELMSIAVRTKIPPLNVFEPLRREARGATGDQVLYEVHTMDQLASMSIARQRFLLLLFGVFAGLALVLACVGIYGVLAYLTSQRVPEFGVRMALGARARDVMWLVLRQSLGMIFAGVAVGTAGALAAGRLLQHLVDGMQPAEPTTFAITIPVLVVAALFASFLPARRASRIDPMSALRQE